MSRIHTDLPPDAADDKNELIRLVNERMRRLASLASTGGTSGSSANVLLLTVPGTLSTRSNAAPLVQLPAMRAIAGLTALVKQAPAGGSLDLQLYAAGSAVASISVADGQTSAEASVNAVIVGLVTLDITGVGSTFPGSDLTLVVRLA